MDLQMHDTLYGDFVGCTKQDQKLGINPTLTYFDIKALIIESKNKDEKSVKWK